VYRRRVGTRFGGGRDSTHRLDIKKTFETQAENMRTANVALFLQLTTLQYLAWMVATEKGCGRTL